MNKYGKLMALLQKSKKLSVKYITGEKMHRTTYERFIKGDCKSSVDNFIYMINQLCIDFEEFMMLSEEYSNFFYEEIVYEFEQAILVEDINQLKKLLKIVTDYCQKNNDSNHIYHHLLLMISLNISNLTNHDFNTDDLLNIKNYLLNCEWWTTYELFIFNNIIFVFNLKMIQALLPRILRRLSSQYELYKSQKMRVQIILKVISLYITKNNLEKANILITKLKSTKLIWNKNHLLVNEEINLLFFEGIVEVLIYHSLIGKQKIKDAIATYKLINYAYVIFCKNYINKIKLSFK